MKKDFLKKLAVFSITACMLSTNLCYAGVANSGSNVKMTDVYVSGNNYKSVVKGTKKESNKTLSVLVSRMLKDDKDSSNYKYSYWQVVNTTDGVTLNAGVKATKGTVCKIALSQKVSTSKTISVCAKGNNNNLDTVISGYIYDFNK